MAERLVEHALSEAGHRVWHEYDFTIIVPNGCEQSSAALSSEVQTLVDAMSPRRLYFKGFSSDGRNASFKTAIYLPSLNIKRTPRATLIIA